MKLDYNILWIDDRPNHVKSAVEYIETKLVRHGFSMNLQKLDEVKNLDDFGKRIKREDYDLIVVDYKMQPGAPTGDKLIRQIRRYNGATDIIFYSSDSPENLREQIDVDGVYCTNRNDINIKLWSVVNSTIKKALDLNHMRGLHLSSVANFDGAADDLISMVSDLLKKEKHTENYTKLLLDKVSSYHEKSLESVVSQDPEAHISIYLELLSSDKKVVLLKEMLSEIKGAEFTAHIAHLDSYVDEMLVPRNKLAHYMVKEKVGGKYVLSSAGKQDVEFNNDDFTLLRTKAQDYHDTFQSLNSQLKSYLES